MSRYISRTFSAHWTIASRSSFWIFPSVRRQRSFASSRIVRSRRSACVEHVGEQPVAELARLLEVLRVDARDELRVLLGELARPSSSASTTRLMCFVTAPFFEPVACVLLRRGAARARRGSAPPRSRPSSSSRGDSLRSSRIAALRTSSRIFFESSVVILRGELDEDAADERPRLLERRQRLLLGPVGEAAGPEVVVLVEALLLALGEVLAPAREPLLERRELLVAVDVDLRGGGLHLVLEVVQVVGALLVVDRGDDRGGEVEHLLELARGDVEQVADAARDALEEPDVRDRRGEVDVAHALAAHLLPRHLDAAALADDALVADALVLAAVALPVLRRTEDALAEEAVALGLERAVVDRLGLRDLAGSTSRGSAWSTRARSGSRRTR